MSVRVVEGNRTVNNQERRDRETMSDVERDEDGPPTKRLSCTLTIDAHNLDDLHDLLRRVAMDVLDLDGGQREQRQVISGEWCYTIKVRNPEPYTVEEYTEQLLAWHHRTLAARRARRSAASSGGGS